MSESLKSRNLVEEDRPVKLTKTLMNQYRESLENRGCRQQTISMYFCYLNRLYSYLPGNKELTDKNIKKWIADLKSQGYSNRTINLHLSSVNGLLKFCGSKNVPMPVISVPRHAEMSELTRDEYLKLLSYTKEHGSDRDYILIKTLGTIDIEVADLDCLTVESCRNGKVKLSNNKEIVIPDCLKHELLIYIEEHGPDTGPIFISRQGNSMDRSNITHSIEKLGKEAGIEWKKCNPSALHRLYRHTQEEINQQLLSMHMQVYEQLLENEQKVLNDNDKSVNTEDLN